MHAFDPFATPSFKGLPDALLGRVADFLDRSSQVCLAKTSRKYNRIVSDPIMVPKRWPLKYAGLLHRREGLPDPTMVFPSPNGKRMAVFYPSVSRDKPARFDVWDVEKGILGWINCGYLRDFVMKPVFSPDSEILLFGEAEKEPRGIVRVASNLSNTKRGRLSCTTHRLHDSQRVQRVTFLDNATISYNVSGEHNLKLRKVIRPEVRLNDNGAPNTSTIISFDEPNIIFEPNLEMFRNTRFVNLDLHHSHSASFIGQQKAIHLLAISYTSEFLCYDAANDSTTILSISRGSVFPSLVDLIFSHDGQTLVILFYRYLALFDCNVNNTETIPEVPVVSLCSDQFDGLRKYVWASFLPEDNSKIVATFSISRGGGGQIRVLDLKSRQILSAGWNETTWKCIAGYDVDGHVGLLRVVDNEDDDDSEPEAAED